MAFRSDSRPEGRMDTSEDMYLAAMNVCGQAVTNVLSKHPAIRNKPQYLERIRHIIIDSYHKEMKESIRAKHHPQQIKLTGDVVGQATTTGHGPVKVTITSTLIHTTMKKDDTKSSMILPDLTVVSLLNAFSDPSASDEEEEPSDHEDDKSADEEQGSFVSR